MEKKTLIEIFGEIEDPRVNRTKVYELIEILFLVLSSTVSGFSTWESIEEFGESKLEWLRKFLPYQSGIPSHDTINRVMSRINPRVLEKCLIDWTNMNIELPIGAVISIDGKSLRRSVKAKEQHTKKVDGGKQAVHILHVWCSSINVCLAQQKVESKSKEITDFPKILSLLDIESCIVTTDSMNCQKSSVEAIISNGADYAIAVKANQPTLLNAIEKAFEQEDVSATNRNHIEEQSHGRTESRLTEILSAQAIKKEVHLDVWTGIKTIIRTTSTRKEPFKAATTEVRYHISSLDMNVQNLSSIIRSHWSVENNLHWTLDVCFGEDNSRKRVKNAAENFSFIRKIALNFLNRLQTLKKASIPTKMAKCALNDKTREICLEIHF